IDETSKDERTQIQRYGRAKRSRYASMKGAFVRGRHFTVVAALTIDGIIAGHVLEGSLHRNGYLHFLEHSVVSQDSSHLTFFVNSCSLIAAQL
ncbi:hypothetical protein DFJ58DRAFT_660137, partial [Suillus subalutaceus]|uniref:uncharacterized protein n=1 Tax=Suillus subalutaceus TaxID=48586 RepID=UPI001B885EF2